MHEVEHARRDRNALVAERVRLDIDNAARAHLLELRPSAEGLLGGPRIQVVLGRPPVSYIREIGPRSLRVIDQGRHNEQHSPVTVLAEQGERDVADTAQTVVEGEAYQPLPVGHSSFEVSELIGGDRTVAIVPEEAKCRLEAGGPHLVEHEHWHIDRSGGPGGDQPRW